MINDDEIDLTENRDFREHKVFFYQTNGTIKSNFSAYVNQMLHKQIYGEFPWNVTPDPKKYSSYKYDGLIALGNKEQREEAILSRTWGTIDNIICDCCGKEYIKIPWKKDWGLCEECNKRNYKQVFPWDT